MPSLPLSQVSSASLQKIRLVATDMDGTLTCDGKFTPALLQTLQDLATAGLTVLIVTGRSAGWVSGLVSYLPIMGAIAENGGLFYPAHSEAPVLLTAIADITVHRQHLHSVFQKLQHQIPQIRESADNTFRLTDWTFDVSPLNTEELLSLDQLCQQQSWGFTYSNVQCHIKPQGQDKAVGLLQVLRQYFPEYSQEQVLTVGDSPNDESLFAQSDFPISVGVANVKKYAQNLRHQPAYITTASEGEGFCELAQLILQQLADDKKPGVENKPR